MDQQLPTFTVTGIVSAHRLLRSPVGVISTRKDREHWAIVLKIQGKTIYRVGEQEVCSDKDHLIILPKGLSYCWKCVEPGECIIVDFDTDSSDDRLYTLPGGDNTPFIRGFARIQKFLTLKNPGWREGAMGELYNILAQLRRDGSRQYAPASRQQLLTPAVEYMTEYYSDPGVTNDLLAARCGISTVYFRKTFESAYGISPIRYLQHLRMEKAKSMLSSDFESISQVAESVGYNSIFHFSKMFRQYTGMSPSDYAKSSAGK